jgi:two-component system CheB/CheR fusion protein
MTEVFNIRPGDRGRPITDLSSSLRLPDFGKDIAKVMRGTESIERRTESEDGTRHYLVRLAPYRNGNHKTDGAVVAFVNVTGLTQAESRQQMLIAELQHRTRNLLAVVASIASQTLPGGAPLGAFTARLGALGRLQGLLGKATRERVELGDIVRLEVETIAGTEAGKATISGPVVMPTFEYVQTIALVIHELTTNAVKYGAFTARDGHLAVTWRVEDENLVLEWKESGLSTPPESSRRGFGRLLIEKALAFSLRAETALVFEPDGVYCRIQIPLADKRERPVTP